MKRNMVIVACFMASVFSHAAEPKATAVAQIVHESYHDYNCDETIIRLIKGSLHEMTDGKVDVMVVGRNQQRFLLGHHFGNVSCVGQLDFTENVIWVKNKGSESVSEKKMDSKLLSIVEPHFIRLGRFDYEKNMVVKENAYCPNRQDSEDKNSSTRYQYFGDEARRESAKDLAVCFKNVFAKLVIEGRETPGLYIGFSSLGAPVGMFAEDAIPVAVDTVIGCIKNNPKAFGMVKFAIENNAEFELYEKLLNEKFSKIN